MRISTPYVQHLYTYSYICVDVEDGTNILDSKNKWQKDIKSVRGIENVMKNIWFLPRYVKKAKELIKNNYSKDKYRSSADYIQQIDIYRIDPIYREKLWETTSKIASGDMETASWTMYNVPVSVMAEGAAKYWYKDGDKILYFSDFIHNDHYNLYSQNPRLWTYLQKVISYTERG